MWLFHFRVGGEIQNNSRFNAQGIGHAKRCISMIETLKRTTDDQYMIVANNNKEAKSFIKQHNLDHYPERMLASILSDNQCKMIVSDINYLENDIINVYNRHRPWTSLAPRGQQKYYADLAFKDVYFNYENPPQNIVSGTVYSGPMYSVASREFDIVRAALEKKEILKQPKTIVVSMGGIDHFDLTSCTIKGLTGLSKNWTVRVIIGPLYKYQNELKRSLTALTCNVELYQDPPNMLQVIAESSFGIFGAGLVAYEAIGLGTPCLNIGQTEFHAKRGSELEQLKVGIYLGDADKIYRGQIANKIMKLYKKPEQLLNMRKNGMDLVDGKGAQRIINIMLDYLNAKEKH